MLHCVERTSALAVKMAKLIDVFRYSKSPLRRRQLPLMIDESLTMVMDLNDIGLIFDNNPVRGKALEEFVAKYHFLSPKDVPGAFTVHCKDLLHIINQIVPCVGCRRSVERLFCQLMETGHEALDPLVFTKGGVLTIKKERLASPQLLCSMLHGHRARLSNLVESQTRSKKSHRCNFHSLESHRTPRTMTGIWREVWDCMEPQCKDEVVLIESSTLLVTLESYLRKHRFCTECRTKVLRAYSLLIEEPDPGREKGYSPALYAGIKRCLPEKHIHLQTKTDYIGNLITRADLELMGSRRERHAKTLEIAQEEVLTCLGLCVYERLYRIHLRMREEECTCQVLAGVAVEALYRSFEMAVDVKRGMSQLELLYEQITKEEIAKQQRREHKKLKRKKKKERRAGLEGKDACECDSEDNGDSVNDESPCSCTCSDGKRTSQSNDRRKLQVLDCKSDGSPTCSCKDCRQRKSLNQNSIEGDGGGGHDEVSRVDGASSEVPLASNRLENSAESETSETVPEESRVNGDTCRQSPVLSESGSVTAGRRARRGRKGRRCFQQESSVSSSSTAHSAVPPAASDILGSDVAKPDSVEREATFSLSPCQSCKDVQETVVLIRESDSRVDVSHCSPPDLNGCSDGASVSSSWHSSPEGSDVACSEGFCSHDGDNLSDQLSDSHTCALSHNAMKNGSYQNGVQLLSLQQMLEELRSSDDDDGEESYIPPEEIQEFKARMLHLTEKRQQLRQILKKRFDLLCVNPPVPRPFGLRPTIVHQTSF